MVKEKQSIFNRAETNKPMHENRELVLTPSKELTPEMKTDVPLATLEGEYYLDLDSKKNGVFVKEKNDGEEKTFFSRKQWGVDNRKDGSLIPWETGPEIDDYRSDTHDNETNIRRMFKYCQFGLNGQRAIVAGMVVDMTTGERQRALEANEAKGSNKFKILKSGALFDVGIQSSSENKKETKIDIRNRDNKKNTSLKFKHPNFLSQKEAGFHYGKPDFDDRAGLIFVPESKKRENSI